MQFERFRYSRVTCSADVARRYLELVVDPIEGVAKESVGLNNEESE